VAVVHLRVRRTPAATGVFRAPAAAAWTFLLVELGVAVGCLVRTPNESAYGAAALVTGAAAWHFWRRAR
jgi:hypothetical protein